MKSTNIDGYQVDYEGADENGITQCYIQKGKHSASLEGLLMSGCISDSNWNDVPVAQSTISKIEAWARNCGY